MGINNLSVLFPGDDAPVVPVQTFLVQDLGNGAIRVSGSDTTVKMIASDTAVITSPQVVDNGNGSHQLSA